MSERNSEEEFFNLTEALKRQKLGRIGGKYTANSFAIAL